MSATHENGLPKPFTTKKAQILAEITDHGSVTYNDKSPKGTIDAEIIDLIHEINTFPAFVTTSSCAGRVAVFVEGNKATLPTRSEQNDTPELASTGSGPGGKGHGNKWLFVSHEPVSHANEHANLHELFGLEKHGATALPGKGARLIKLSFSPLILHVLCADLRAAKPLLSAAINAGFRESGVHSLKILDEPGNGVMVGIRTAGLAFESVVGYVSSDDGQERYMSCVSEEYLAMCLQAINERFEWNMDRKERLRGELRWIAERAEKTGKEDKDARRRRKKAAGLQRQREAKKADPGGAQDIVDMAVEL